MKVSLLLTALASVFLLSSGSHAGSKPEKSVFPEDCWGVYSWGGWNINRVNRETHPLIKGAPMILKWREVEPEPGVFLFDEILGKQLKEAQENNFYTFLMIWVAPGAPEWLYQNGVPELEMTPTIGPLGQARDWTFQYYLDEDYIRFFHRLLTEFGNYIRDLPEELRERILYVQSAEGSTGDGWGYKGKPLDLKYDITDDQWGVFRIQAWEVLKAALTDNSGDPVVPILVNYDSNREDQYNWVLKNLRVIGLKNGMFSHGYHISDTKERIRNWRQFSSEVKAAGKEFFSRGEQDAEYKTYGWSTQNIYQGLYWSAIFATHCGLDMWNVPWEASAGYEHKDALLFFNKYAGHHDASTSPAAFCALRKGLDASDVESYPESKYGDANKRNIERYLNIAAAYEQYGAIQGDPPKATGGGMINRKRQDYNDIGWGIHDGNYQRFIQQINPEATSIGWWHKGPVKSIYSRFCRSTDVGNGNNALYFDLDDTFLTKQRAVEIKLIWLDEGEAEWKLRYNAANDPEKVAFTVRNRGTGEWQEKSIILKDFKPGNKGRLGADLLVECDGKDDLVVHLVEVSRK